MKKNYLECGKVVGTHGVRGAVRVLPWADNPQFLCAFESLFLDKNGENKLRIEFSKSHGNITIIKFSGVNSIEEAERLRNKILYLSRNDIELPEGTYFIQDILGMKVVDANTNELLGELSDVSETGSNDVWHVKKDGREYLVPKIPDIEANVDFDKDTVFIKPIKGIFSDED